MALTILQKEVLADSAQNYTDLKNMNHLFSRTKCIRFQGLVCLACTDVNHQDADSRWTVERYTHGQLTAETAQIYLNKLSALVDG